MQRFDFTGKDPDAGKERGQKEKGATQDEMVGWHHQLNGHGLSRLWKMTDREAWRAAVQGARKSRTRLSDCTDRPVCERVKHARTHEQPHSGAGCGQVKAAADARARQATPSTDARARQATPSTDARARQATPSTHRPEHRTHRGGPAGSSLVSQSLAFFLEEPPVKSSKVSLRPRH